MKNAFQNALGEQESMNRKNCSIRVRTHIETIPERRQVGALVQSLFCSMPNQLWPKHLNVLKQSFIDKKYLSLPYIVNKLLLSSEIMENEYILIQGVHHRFLLRIAFFHIILSLPSTSSPVLSNLVFSRCFRLTLGHAWKVERTNTLK